MKKGSESDRSMQKLDITPPHASDEIDLFELFSSLWEQKIVVVLTTAIVVAIAVAYSLLATPVYQVQTTFRQAQLKDLDELSETGIYDLTPKEAFRQFGIALDSYSNRLSFFNANPELFEPLQSEGLTPQQVFEKFNRESLKLIWPDEKLASDPMRLQLTYPKHLDGVSIINGLVAHVKKTTNENIADDFSVLVENRLNQINQNIAAARAGYEAQKQFNIMNLEEESTLKRSLLQDELSALQKRLRTARDNRIAELNEAIQIATALGITKPTTPSALGSVTDSSQGSVIRTEINNRQIPLYFMGKDALEAERKTLLQRSSDDFTEPRIAQIQMELQLLENNRKVEVLLQRKNEDLFLTNIAKWHEEAARLKSLELDTSQLSLARIDQHATKPLRPIKPRKALIAALGLVLGGMLGVFFALIIAMIKKRKAEAAL